MQKYHRTLEFYKTIHDSGGFKIIPARGIYVSGEHLTPWYIDHIITIREWVSDVAGIVDYTTTTASVQPDHIANLISFELLDYEVTRYTAKSDSVTDHIMNLINFALRDPEIIQFEQQSISLTDDHNINLIAFELNTFEKVDAAIVKSVVSEPMLTIRSFISTPATITNDI